MFAPLWGTEKRCWRWRFGFCLLTYLHLNLYPEQLAETLRQGLSSLSGTDLKGWCAACFIQRPHIRWFSNKWKNVFSTVEPCSALILVAGCMLMESRAFSTVLLLLTQPVTFKVPWSTQRCLWAILQPNYSSPRHNPRKALNDALSNAAASATCGSSSWGCLTAGSSLCFAVSRREGHITSFYGDHGKEG